MTTGTASASETGGAFVGPVRPGEVVAEKYRVERTLGVGGMGVVVAARDEVLDRQVAIKFLLPRLAGTDNAVQRFVREARSATRVSSEHVVRLLEIDKLPSGTPFFVMEYLEGRDLRAVLREDGPLAPSVAVDYLLQALQAVAEGHHKGIVHRDIKPGNLFLTARADGTPLIKVLDFGIAKRLERDGGEGEEESSLTSSDDVRLGSPAYMPPEQLQNPRDVDTRSDIWSLGATLYELICGKPPFEGPGYLELVSRILSQPPKPISGREMPHTLPRGLEAVILRCLEKDREARYANAAELAEALAPFGSEDARVSLTRVKGLTTPSPASGTPRVVVDGAGECTTTLAVAADGVQTIDTGAARAEEKPRRAWLVLVAAAAVIGLVVLARGLVVPEAPSAAEAKPSAPVAAPPVVTEPAGPAQPAAVPNAPAAAAAETPPSVAEKPRLAATPHVAVAPAERPAIEVLPEPAVDFPTSLELESPRTKPAAAEPAPPVTPKPTDAGPGRSQEIERLIETRR